MNPVLNIVTNDKTTGRGFFSFFNQVIDALDYTDKRNEALFVDFKEPYFSFGSWEEYFKQPFPSVLNELSTMKRRKRLRFDEPVYSKKFFLSEKEIWRGRYLVRKYISLSKRLPEIKISGISTLGVHVRYTDHSVHGNLLPIEYYIQKAKETMKERRLDRVYLATDSVYALNAFKEAFPKENEQLVYRECIRATGNIAVQNLRNINGVECGWDVLLDAINLSSCQHLLKTASNVTHAALIMSDAMTYENIDSHIKYK